MMADPSNSLSLPAVAIRPWRIRDVATDMLAQRQVVVRSGEALVLSSNFDMETCLVRIRRDKAPIVRNSFEAAASCILDTMDKTEDDGDLESIDEDDLPKALDDIPSLERIRNISMVRAHDNKDPSKRKTSDTTTQGWGGRPPAARSKVDKKTDTTPKFTRNTPASSAAALDSRLTSSRAILCTAANVAFDVLTPPLPGVEVMDVADVPQNPNKAAEGSKNTVNNMGAVVVEAQILGQRIASVATNAARRSARRYQYRKDNLRYDKSPTSVLQVKNPFAWKDTDEGNDFEFTGPEEHLFDPTEGAVTQAWSETCLPRLVSILHTGVGHALYHDTKWKSRHGRIANLFQELAVQDNNYGPHLIITVEPDVDRFAREFRGINSHLRLISSVDTDSIRALKYGGPPELRRRLRKQFPDATGLAEAPFHVIITSYSKFVQDYLHFCQMPFETVVVDDGASLLAAAQLDLNSQIGTLWEAAFFSRSDHQMGLAGATPKEWDFGADEIDEDMTKDAWIGLTARHRILTTSTIHSQSRSSAEVFPVSGLVNFVAPHFADSVREEWDRSRISNDAASMKHFRKLLTRSVVVHAPQSQGLSFYELALQSLTGKLPVPDRSEEPVPEIISDDVFVADQKIAQSRRSALQWFGRAEDSWLRYELGSVSFQPIIDAMKTSGLYGHLCEEIVTASSTTTTGATGQVAGTLAYRLAVRCGRHFGSEQGLRQHLSALHAPPGTWLCRTCGSDCITSQARTHHERSCGQPSAAAESENPTAPTPGGAVASKGPKQTGPSGVVGKKKASKTTHGATEEKDPDGSIRVSGYRGVWVNQAGKHFVKINGKRLTDDNGKEMLFPGVEEAAKKHDEYLKSTNPKGKVEYNYKPDGTRVVYEDVSTSSTTGIGGGAASVVPALSVINIKDLPPDVKPLLRDPRQTSRTGGNSKRHVYAYRGVCRQARKGHDRWQSQISFMGVNHYLGTFDSEWDAAAIYAWAHLILYGEEATRQAQKEGEEAAAAYEKEKRDIAAGIAPPPPAKPEKKQKRKPGRKAGSKEEGSHQGDESEKTDDTIAKRKRGQKDEAGPEKKKPKTIIDKESLAPIFAKSTGRATVLAPRHIYAELSDIELVDGVAKRLTAARQLSYALTEFLAPAPIPYEIRPCAPVSTLTTPFMGGAMLLGLSPSLFGWYPETCLASRYFDSDDDAKRAEAALTAQFGARGDNECFRTLVQGTITTLGCASYRTQRVYTSFNMGAPPIGGAVGSIDCHIGGSPKFCSESAASIRHLATSTGCFQFSALSDDDIVTLNGKRITPAMGSFPLFNEDICTVGPRVFVFLLPTDA